MPETAYETGYVKYDDERFVVWRCEGDDVCDDGGRKGGEDGLSAGCDMTGD